NSDGLGEALAVVVVVSKTVCPTGFDVAVLKLAAPLYCAVMVCGPSGRAGGGKFAVPLLRATVEPGRGGPADRKETVPVGTSLPPYVTTAVKVTFVPRSDLNWGDESVRTTPTCISTAPMSLCGPMGRAKPRWSTLGASASPPASRAGLPASRA